MGAMGERVDGRNSNNCENANRYNSNWRKALARGTILFADLEINLWIGRLWRRCRRRRRLRRGWPGAPPLRGCFVVGGGPAGGRLGFFGFGKWGAGRGVGTFPAVEPERRGC